MTTKSQTSTAPISRPDRRALPARPEVAPLRTGDVVSRIHEVRNCLKEDVFYPAHDKRKESPKYAAVHKKLVDEQGLGCLVCAVTKATLKDPAKNPYGAKALETHHHTVEWSLAKAIDLAKFNERVVARMRLRPGHDRCYDQPFTQQQMEDWVDHSPDNLWVLCDVHHRHPYLGIHTISGPIWGAQDLLRPGMGAIEPKNTGPVADGRR